MEKENKIARTSDLKDTLMYKLRLSRLSKTQRLLQKYGVATKKET